jgi:hypothetical protein
MFGDYSGRRARRMHALPLLGKLPFSNSQKTILDAKANLIQNSGPWINPKLSSNSNAPSTGDSVTVTPAASGTLAQPFIALPAPGAGAVTVISYTVQRAKLAMIRYLAIAFYGGNDPSGSGQVIWRVLKNGGGIRGLHKLITTIGTMAAPQLLPAPIIGIENDTIVVTAEVPAGFQAVSAAAGTAAMFVGFETSISESTTPAKGTY